MPNPNYIRGRKFEWDLAKDYRDMGFRVIRASGSHGEFDLVVYRPGAKPEFVQCKTCQDEAVGVRMVKAWALLPAEQYYHQTIAIKVMGKSKVLSATV